MALKLLLSLIGIVAALGVAEGAIRVLAPQAVAGTLERTLAAFRGAYRLHPTYRYEMAADLSPRRDRQPDFSYTFATNHDGLRDRSVGAKGDAYRIVSLGDSFAFGLGVEHDRTYAKVLEGLLRDGDRGRRAEVINAGVPGYGTAHQYFFLRDKMLAYEPDLVIVGFYVGNDLFDNLEFEDAVWHVDERGYLVRRGGTATGGEGNSGLALVKAWLRRHLHAYHFVAWKLQDLRLARGRWTPAVARVLGPYLMTPPPEVAQGWARTRQWLRDTKALLDARDVRLLVAVIPFEFQVNTGAWAARFFRERAGEYALDRPQHLLQSLCAEERLQCLDLLPALRVHARAGAQLYFREGHWTEEGHRVAATLLAERLTRDRAALTRAASAAVTRNVKAAAE